MKTRKEIEVALERAGAALAHIVESRGMTVDEHKALTAWQIAHNDWQQKNHLTGAKHSDQVAMLRDALERDVKWCSLYDYTRHQWYADGVKALAATTPAEQAPSEPVGWWNEQYQNFTPAKWLSMPIEETPAWQRGEVVALFPHPASAPHAAEAAKWISVDERMPEDNQVVIVAFWPYDNRENAQIVGQAEHVQGVFYNDDGDDHHYPSHWMPLPAIPAAPVPPAEVKS